VLVRVHFRNRATQEPSAERRGGGSAGSHDFVVRVIGQAHVVHPFANAVAVSRNPSPLARQQTAVAMSNLVASGGARWPNAMQSNAAITAYLESTRGAGAAGCRLSRMTLLTRMKIRRSEGYEVEYEPERGDDTTESEALKEEQNPGEDRERSTPARQHAAPHHEQSGCESGEAAEHLPHAVEPTRQQVQRGR